MEHEGLSQYQQKRDFERTPEPAGNSSKKGERIFVVQEHHASHLHYDFRLEIGGTLKSWAIPKGPSTDPSDKRLAIPTEDHPVEYANFEGEIPDGEYGAGQVYIWDRGTFEDLKTEEDGRPPEEHYEEGKIEIKLHGFKLTGNFALTKMKDKKEWLLIKMKE